MNIKTCKNKHNTVVHFNDTSLCYQWATPAELIFIVGIMVSIGFITTEDGDLYPLEGSGDNLILFEKMEDTLFHIFEYSIYSAGWFQDMNIMEHIKWKTSIEESQDYYSRIEYQRINEHGVLEFLDFSDDVPHIQQWFNTVVTQEPERIFRYLQMFQSLSVEQWLEHIQSVNQQVLFSEYFDVPDFYGTPSLESSEIPLTI